MVKTPTTDKERAIAQIRRRLGAAFEYLSPKEKEQHIRSFIEVTRRQR
jgi:hypothetical protein